MIHAESYLEISYFLIKKPWALQYSRYFLDSAHIILWLTGCVATSLCFQTTKNSLELTLISTTLEKNIFPLVDTYPHLAQQNQRESCHQMCPDLKVRQNTLIYVKYKIIHVYKPMKTKLRLIKLLSENQWIPCTDDHERDLMSNYPPVWPGASHLVQY